MEQRTSSINTLDTVIIGDIEISFTDWTDGAEPMIAAGSHCEIGGSMFYATGDDDLDVAAAWAGIANSTLVYIYYAIAGTTATAELSITAPTWDDAKQGYYDAGATKRCVGSIYKDSAGNYDQKTIFLNQFFGKTNTGINIGGNSANADRIERDATDAYRMWDESDDHYYFSKDITTPSGDLGEYATNSSLSQVLLLTVAPAAQTYFYLKKPITAYIKAASAPGSGIGTLYIKQNNVLYGIIASALATPIYNLQLNPGYYDLSNATDVNISLYCSGVFGLDSIVAADIVV